MRCRAMRTWLIVLALLATWPLPAAAQSCSADVQCRNGGRPYAECIGDTLIVRRQICSGTCRDVEERRQNCRSLESGRCSGAHYERVTTRCTTSLGGGTCERRVDRELCVATCSCQGNRLHISTGQCSPVSGCGRRALVCKGGCSCSPEPECRGQ